MREEIYVLIKKLQFKSWWFNGRRKIIEAYMNRFVDKSSIKILDIGSGYGGLIPLLSKYGEVDVIEPYEKAHAALLQLGARHIFTMGDFPKTYPNQRYDVVTLFDVLEHIEQDSLTLRVVREHLLLKPHGMCFITVPAYRWLWSEIDDLGGHYRRYTRKDLLQLMREAGFKNIKCSYFMCLLFPLKLIDQAVKKVKFNSQRELKPVQLNPILNKSMESILSFERRLVTRVFLPYGESIIAKGDIG